VRNTATGAAVSKQYPDPAIELIWNRLPRAVRSRKLTQASGHRIYRHPPQLDLLRDLAFPKQRGTTLEILVLGYSTGAELYLVVCML
jgi:hypothetical protein